MTRRGGGSEEGSDRGYPRGVEGGRGRKAEQEWAKEEDETEGRGERATRSRWGQERGTRNEAHSVPHRINPSPPSPRLSTPTPHLALNLPWRRDMLMRSLGRGRVEWGAHDEGTGDRDAKDRMRHLRAREKARLHGSDSRLPSPRTLPAVLPQLRQQRLIASRTAANREQGSPPHKKQGVVRSAAGPATDEPFCCVTHTEGVFMQVFALDCKAPALDKESFAEGQSQEGMAAWIDGISVLFVRRELGIQLLVQRFLDWNGLVLESLDSKTHWSSLSCSGALASAPQTYTFVYMAFLRMDGRMYRRDSTLQLCQPEVKRKPCKTRLCCGTTRAAEWDRNTTGANYLHRPFTYLARQGKKGVYQVYTLALAQWRQHLFAPLQPPLTSAILRLVAAQRDGASIDQALVKKVVDSFVSLGLDVYKEQFEAPFLTATETYYFAEAEAFLDPVERGGGEWEYPGVFEEGGGEAEEEERVALLDFDADEDLQRIYALLARIPEGLEPSGANSKHTQGRRRQGQGRGKAGELDPKAYVDALLTVHEKDAATVARSFKGEAGFAAALDKACRELVNQNAATGTSAARLLELLAKRADMLLRKSNKVAGDVDLEGALNWAMVLFKYLEDKNVFQTFYTTKLSKRLIHGVSASDEAEASMISKLEEVYEALSDEALRPQAHLAAQLLQERAADKLTNQKAILMTAADQAAVLLQYNGNDTLSLTELQEATNFSPVVGPAGQGKGPSPLPLPGPARSRRHVLPMFLLEGYFRRRLPLPAPSPLLKVIPKMLVTLRSPTKADHQVSVRSPSRLEISAPAANLVFNSDNSWDTAEITSPPNAPVAVDLTELLHKQQDAAANKVAMIQVLEATEQRIQEATKAAVESVEHRLTEVERKLTEEHDQQKTENQQSLKHIVCLRREQMKTTNMLIPGQDLVEVHESLSCSIQVEFLGQALETLF
ncbi:Cullin family-domain-containing protein [Mycena albidolilacea]|uniref:Cullin family-domain-containing protein n=1 Tax=Mycena albidolilacea TaxID=1033008 RepID=A0AAD6Z5S9_9AGAR|nr:Cullin family-domain-containing protein [Mycena albidolilacea]